MIKVTFEKINFAGDIDFKRWYAINHTTPTGLYLIFKRALREMFTKEYITTIADLDFWGISEAEYLSPLLKIKLRAYNKYLNRKKNK